MPTLTSSTHNGIHPRRPHDSQKILGGNMSMMCFVRSQCPRKLDPPEQCQIKGLNVEAVVEIPIPPSSWLASPEYWDLSLRTNDDDSNCAFFSLNLSMYPPTFDVFEWDDKWFFLYGLVHPYALTWEVKPDDGVDTNNDPQDYTIPALMVRDHGYQPIDTRMLDGKYSFPLIPPMVSFTGLVIGPGRTLLREDAISGLGEIQGKCCGFIQLSTFITPGDPTKTPFKGYHPFQVFVIFPIHVLPWPTRCKRMIEKPETDFRPGTVFTCTGKVAGFLDHDIMVHPPQLTQDYVFIVVPDTWTFHDKADRSFMSTSPSVTALAKQPSTNSSDRAKFMTPSRRATQLPASPTVTTASSCSPTPTAHSTSSSVNVSDTHTTPSSKRSNQSDCTTPPSSPPSKKPRTMQAVRDAKHNSNHSSTEPVQSSTTLGVVSIDSTPSPSLDDTTRPHRNRRPARKFSPPA